MSVEPKGKIIVTWNYQQEGLRGPVPGLFGLVREVREDFVEGASGQECGELGVGDLRCVWGGMMI